MKADQMRWDEKFKAKGFALGKEPNPFLKKCLRFLPVGKALDIAAGEGRNAVFLAQNGFEVDAVDLSERGLKKARKLAKEAGVEIHTILSDLDDYRIEKEKYDPSLSLAFRIARLFRKPIEQVFHYDNDGTGDSGNG